jgi:uncharacterized OB-fold protein
MYFYCLSQKVNFNPNGKEDLVMTQNAEKKRVPVVKGWFDMDAGLLVGNRCKTCGDVFFPRVISCRNPNCRGRELDEITLSTKGKLWSFTTNCYKPPAPYVSPEPFVPYTIVVVNLDQEKLGVVGQLAQGVALEKLKEGMEMELIMEALYADKDGTEHIIWKWKPAA